MQRQAVKLHPPGGAHSVGVGGFHKRDKRPLCRKNVDADHDAELRSESNNVASCEDVQRRADQLHGSDRPTITVSLDSAPRVGLGAGVDAVRSHCGTLVCEVKSEK